MIKLTKREIGVIKKGIEDYKTLERLVKGVVTKDSTFNSIKEDLYEIKHLDTWEAYCDNGEEFIDFGYKSINTSIWKDDVWKLSSSFEIYDKEIGECIIEDYLSMNEYERIIKENEKDIEIKNQIVDNTTWLLKHFNYNDREVEEFVKDLKTQMKEGNK